MSDHRGEGSTAQESESVHKLGPDGAAEPDSGPLIGPHGRPLGESDDTEPQGYDIPPQPASATPQEQERIEAVTAFIVYQTPDGHWVATADVEMDLMIQRPAHFNDFVAACAVVEKDVVLTQTVQNTIQNFFAAGEQMRQQMENARIAQQLQGGGLGGPGMPNRQGRRHPGR